MPIDEPYSATITFRAVIRPMLRPSIFAFDTVPVLEQLSLSLRTGSVTGLLDRNGAGKTTLMRVMLGLLKPGAGAAQLWETRAWDAPLEIRHRIGYVPQTFDSFQSLRIQECLDLIGSFYQTWDTAFIAAQRDALSGSVGV
jgi:ABC-type multidrug transport system ATPase subunit